MVYNMIMFFWTQENLILITSLVFEKLEKVSTHLAGNMAKRYDNSYGG